MRARATRLSRNGSADHFYKISCYQADKEQLPLSTKAYLSGRRRRPSKGQDGTRAALYLRVSTADQKPDLQSDGLRAYAARAGLDIIRDYCDAGVSGRRDGRPQLNALMAAARNHEIDCVLATGRAAVTRQRPVSLLARDGQDRSDEPNVGQRPAILRDDQCFQLVEFRFRWLVACELLGMLEVVDDRPEGAVYVVGRALEAQSLDTFDCLQGPV